MAATAHRWVVPAGRHGESVLMVAATARRWVVPAGRRGESVRVVAAAARSGRDGNSACGACGTDGTAGTGGRAGGVDGSSTGRVGSTGQRTAVRRAPPSSMWAEQPCRARRRDLWIGAPLRRQQGSGTHVRRTVCRRSRRPGQPVRHPTEWNRAWTGSAEAPSRADRAAHRCRRDPGSPTRCSASSREGRRQPRALRSWRRQPPTWLPRAAHGEVVVSAYAPSSVEVGVGSLRRARVRHGTEWRDRREAPVRAAGRRCPAPPRRRHAPARAGRRRRRLPTGRRGGRGRSSSWLAFEVASERSDAAMLQGFHRSR